MCACACAWEFACACAYVYVSKAIYSKRIIGNTAQTYYTQVTHCSRIRNGISSRNEYFLTTNSCLQWDLVCDKDSYVEITQTLFNVGIVIGFFLFTPFADRYGRKKVLFTCHFFMDVFGIVLAFSPDLISFCVCQFLTGMCAAVSTFILSWARAPLVVYSVVRWLVNRD